MSNNKDVKRGIVLYIDGKAVKNDVTAIKAEIKKLTKELDHMAIGSREYNEQMAKIRDLNAIIKQHKAEIRAVNEEQHLSLSKGVDLFNKYAASVTAVVAALTGVVLKLNSFRKMLHEREDAKANLMALTGLDDDSIGWLEQQAVELSTTMDKSGLRIRQSASKILEAYMLVGSNKPELLADKEALNAVTIEAMRLSSASGMDLKQSVNAVTTALNQYGAGADKAAKYVNVLAAGSKVGASAVDAQTSAILKAGTIAATSNIPLEQLVGTIEMLGEKGIKNEIAGTGLKTFFTRLATGAADTNPKVVGLYTALDNLNQKVKEAEMQQVGGGTTLLKKLFGDEGMQTAMILTQNADKVRYYTEAVTDTNIAMEQAAINSDTAAAKLEQVKNELNEQGIVLMKELNPAITSFLNRLVNWSRYTVSLVKFIADNRTALSLLTTSVVLYTTWVNRKNIADKMQLFWNQKLLVSFRALNTTMKANPYVLLAAGVITAVGVLADLKRKQDAVTQSMRSMDSINKKSTEDFDKQASRVELLTKIVHNNNMSLNTRRERLEELKSIVPGYNAQLTEEGKIIQDNTDAIKDYLVQLEKQIKLKSAEDELTELLGKQRKVENRLRSEEEAALKAKNNLLAAQTSASLQASRLGTSGMKTMYGALAQAPKTMQAEYSKAAAAVSATKTELDGLAKAIGVIQKEVSDRKLDLTGSADSTGSSDSSDVENPLGGSTADNDIFLEENKRYFEELAALKTRYINSDTMTREEYSRLAEELEMQHLQRKLEIAGVEPETRAAIQQQILDLQIKLKETAAKQLETQTKEQSDKALSEHEKRFELEVEAATRRHYQTMTSEEEYQQEIARLTDNYYNAILNDTRVSEEEKAKIIQSVQQKSLDDEKAIYDKKTLQFNNMKNSIVGAAESMGEAMAKFFTDEETDFGDFMANVLTIMLDALEKQLIAQQAAAIAAVTINDISTKGLAGIATAAAKIALITAAFESAKAVLGNFYTGGYTGSGDWDEPKGIVHSNEFVANRYAVANPAVRPVLDLIDQAQRSGTIANLTGNDIAAVAGSRSMPVTQTPVVVNSTSQPNDRELIQTVRDLRQVINRLAGRLDEPIKAVGVISGRHGWRAKLDEYDQLLNNKSR